MERPHKITFYNILDKVIHVDSFETMDDASRTYDNMRRVIEEGGIHHRIDGKVSKITLSTVYSETCIS